MSEPAWTELEERLLTDVMTGDRQPDDPEVRAAAAANPAFEDALGGMAEVQRELDADAAGERHDIAAAREQPVDVDRDLVAATITRLAAGEARGRAGPRGPRRLLLAISVAAVAALLLIWLTGGFAAPAGVPPEPNDDYQQLGDERFTLRSRALEDGGVQLSWTFAGTVRRYRVSAYDPLAPGAPELDLSGDLEPSTTEWNIQAADLADLPAGAHWRVTAVVGGRDVQASAPLPSR